MSYRAVLYPLSGAPSLRVESDAYNLNTILDAIQVKYGLVFDEKWDGQHDFECKVGTEHQWHKGHTGTLVIKQIASVGGHEG